LADAVVEFACDAPLFVITRLKQTRGKLAETVVRSVQLRCSFFDSVFQSSVQMRQFLSGAFGYFRLAARLRFSIFQPQKRGDGRHEFGAINGLGQVRIRSALKAVHARVWIGESGRNVKNRSVSRFGRTFQTAAN